MKIHPGQVWQITADKYEEFCLFDELQLGDKLIVAKMERTWTRGEYSVYTICVRGHLHVVSEMWLFRMCDPVSV